VDYNQIRTYRITYRDRNYTTHEMPVMATSAHQAVASLQQLGYDVTKVTHSFPSI